MCIPLIIPVGKGHSLFEFIANHCLGEPQEFGVIAMHRLCSLMRKMGVETAIVHEMDPQRDEINKECNALFTYYGKSVDVKAFKITFISQEVADLHLIPTIPAYNFLASAIVINFLQPDKNQWRSYIYGAVVTLPRMPNSYMSQGNILPLLNNYIHIRRKFTCRVKISADEEHAFEILGTYFSQQNTRTSVCAHVALSMTINNMGITGSKRIESQDINEIIGFDHINKKLTPQRPGLSGDEIQEVLKAYGLNYKLIDFFEDPNYAYNDFVYRYIESRCPILLFFSIYGVLHHVVPVLGHTLNTDLWRPEAEPLYAVADDHRGIKSSSSWVDHFIIHDDNMGMYLSMPVEALKRITIPKYDPSFRAKSAIAIIPAQVKTRSIEAEIASGAIIKDTIDRLIRVNISLDEWTKKIATSSRPLVIRTLLAKRDSYVRSLREPDFEGNYFSKDDREKIAEDLPEDFWLSEISIPDLYTANRTKIIDVFYGAYYEKWVSMQEIHDRWLQIRFPHALIKQKPEKEKPEDRYSTYPLSVKSHYPLFCFEDRSKSFDW